MADFSIQEIKTYGELLKLIKSSGLDYDLDLIDKAYKFAESIHKDQIRASGESYLNHVITVAGYIVSLKLDSVSIAAALLHDSIEKGNVDLDKLDKEFGTEIAYIVNGVSQVRDYTKKIADGERDIENFKNLIFNATEDIRIIIIRLCEKLHNLQTVDQFDSEAKIKAAKKGLNIYGPLAEYLGLGFIQRKIEDISFKILHSDEYPRITKFLDNLYKDSQDVLIELENQINELLLKYNFKAVALYSRRKSNYSIYKKLKRKFSAQAKQSSDSKVEKDYVTFENVSKLYDIFAVRIIVQSVEECYMVLGLIHSKWEYIQEEYNDYIAQPKENGYRSLQTNIKFDNKVIEIQIRTQEMHEYNEFGPASHIAYKMSGSKNAGNSMTWTKDLVKWKNNENFSKDDFKVKAFSQRIFVFTPKGLVISLPKDSSPIDFAFRIHTKIGYHYAGALVNKKMVSMDYKLQTGDVVEILTNKNINANQGWMKFAKANTTKNRIRKIIKHEKDEVYGVN